MVILLDWGEIEDCYRRATSASGFRISITWSTSTNYIWWRASVKFILPSGYVNLSLIRFISYSARSTSWSFRIAKKALCMIVPCLSRSNFVKSSISYSFCSCVGIFCYSTEPIWDRSLSTFPSSSELARSWSLDRDSILFFMTYFSVFRVNYTSLFLGVSFELTAIFWVWVRYKSFSMTFWSGFFTIANWNWLPTDAYEVIRMAYFWALIFSASSYCLWSSLAASASASSLSSCLLSSSFFSLAS